MSKKKKTENPLLPGETITKQTKNLITSGIKTAEPVPKKHELTPQAQEKTLQKPKET